MVKLEFSKPLGDTGQDLMIRMNQGYGNKIKQTLGRVWKQVIPYKHQGVGPEIWSHALNNYYLILSIIKFIFVEVLNNFLVGNWLILQLNQALVVYAKSLMESQVNQKQ